MVDRTPLPPTLSGHHSAGVALDSFKHAEKVLAQGDHDYAIQLLRDCCHLAPLNLRYRQALRTAQKMRAAEQAPGALRAFLATLMPRLRLQIARWRGNSVAVLNHGECILASRPNDVSTHLALAEAFEDLEAPVQAIWILEEARRRVPGNVKIVRTLAQFCEKAQRFKEAIRLWELVRKLDPRNAEACDKVKGLSAKVVIDRMDATRPAEIQDDAEPEAHEKPPPADAKAPEVPAATPPPTPPIVNRMEQEAARLQVRIDADPANPHTHLELAVHYRRADRLDLAQTVLQRALAPTHRAFELVMGLADLEIEQLRREFTRTLQQLAERPQDEELAAKRDRLLEQINAREREWYERKLAHEPTQKAYALELGVRLYRARQYRDAIPHLQAAHSGPSQRVRALLHIAYCFKELGNWELARRALEDGLKELPSDETAQRREFLFELACGSFENGDRTTAVQRGNELAFLDFNYREIGQLLEEWRGTLQKA